VKAESQKFGLRIPVAEDRSHAFVKKIVLAKQPVEPLGVSQQSDVFVRGEMCKVVGEGEAAAGLLAEDRTAGEPSACHRAFLPWQRIIRFVEWRP